MKAIVFGGAGFLGSHVAEELSEAGHKVVIFDMKPSPNLRPGQQMIVGDVQNAADVAKAVRGADVVYNFAGIADLREAHENPVETVRTNVLGNCLLLEASVKHHIKRYVFASTLYVYSQSGSFYAASKQACEAYIENYQRYHGLEYTILRYGSLYGSRAPETNTVNRLLREAMTQGKMTYAGTGDETREYIHVDDAARYSVEVLSPEYANQNLIIAGYQPMKVRELMAMIAEMLGGKVRLEFKPEDAEEDGLHMHYNSTPYSYTPRAGRRLIGRQYVDLGQGLLRCMDEIHRAPQNPGRRPRR